MKAAGQPFQRVIPVTLLSSFVGRHSNLVSSELMEEYPEEEYQGYIRFCKWYNLYT